MSGIQVSLGSKVTREWERYILYGWTFDTIESVKEAYYRQGNTEQDLVDYIDEYKRDSYDRDIEPVFSGGAVKLNLGGDNDKTKIVFTDKPIGVFDFGLASQLLYRVQEFYSEDLAKEYPQEFNTYELPSGVVPNYFVEKEMLGNIFTFFYVHPSGKRFLLEKRQKGLTALLEKKAIKTKMIDGMRVPDEPTKGVVFSSKTKKPYIKYLRRGGKVRYVEIYSLNYYTRMTDDNFFMACRHIPVLMVCEYLEKMGTLCKFYVTRTVVMYSRYDFMSTPRKLDLDTSAELPLWKKWNDLRPVFNQKTGYGFGRSGTGWLGQCVIQPKCVKDYGQALDKVWALLVGSNNTDVYDAVYKEMEDHEGDPPKRDPYGYPTWDENQYQEGVERYRQKTLEYIQKGIWKGKEVVEQGLIYFHDLVLNENMESQFSALQNALSSDPDYTTASNNRTIGRYAFTVNYNASTAKWFELWMKISANTIKHKLDIFNSSKPRKTFEEVKREVDAINEELYLLVETTTNQQLKNYLQNWVELVKSEYMLEDFENYGLNKINEMTFYAQGGMFETPVESVEKREAEAKRLRSELKAFVG